MTTKIDAPPSLADSYTGLKYAPGAYFPAGFPQPDRKPDDPWRIADFGPVKEACLDMDDGTTTLWIRGQRMLTIQTRMWLHRWAYLVRYRESNGTLTEVELTSTTDLAKVCWLVVQALLQPHVLGDPCEVDFPALRAQLLPAVLRYYASAGY